MTIFLVIAGITGSLLTFYEELDALIVPQYHHIPARAADVVMLDPVTLREHAVAARPEMIFEAAVPFRFFICFIGAVVAVLSITGVVIWCRKRRPRKGPARRLAAA